jgi:septum formation inhibitor MinC
MLPCGYCGAEVYLPDPVWNRLHPVKTVRPWTLVYGYQGVNKLWTAEAIKEHEEEQKEEQQRHRERLAREVEREAAANAQQKKEVVIMVLALVGTILAVLAAVLW